MHPIARFVALSVLLLSVAGCGGGGGGGGEDAGDGNPDNAIPARVSVLFPGPVGLTDDDEILVRGTSEEPQVIAGIDVGGVPATTTDGFETWQARVPLTLGTNILPVRVEDATGTRGTALELSITREATLAAYPWDMIAGATPNTVLLTDPLAGVLFRCDLLTGARSVVASVPSSLFASTGDGTGQGIYHTDRSGEIRHLALAGGQETLISGGGAGTGPLFDFAFDLEHDATNGLLWVVDRSAHTLVSVDPASGDRSIVSGPSTGNGPAFDEPEAVTVDAPNGRLFVADDQHVFSVSMVTGARTVLYAHGGTDLVQGLLHDAGADVLWILTSHQLTRLDLGTGQGSPVPGSALRDARDVVSVGGRLVVLEGIATSVVGIDPVTGAHEILSRSAVGGGPRFWYPRRLALDREGRRMFVADAQGVFAVDLTSGDRTLVASEVRGTGVDVRNPAAIAYDERADRLFAMTREQLHEIDIPSGDRVLRVDASLPASAPFSRNLGGLVQEPGGLFYSTDQLNQGVVSLDVGTGAWSWVSGDQRGTGPSFSYPDRLALASGLLMVVSGDSIVAVDKDTGDRTELANVLSRSPSGLTAAAGALFMTLGSYSERLERLNLVTGRQETVTAPDRGRGPAPLYFIDLVVDEQRGVAYVAKFAAGGALGMIDLETGDRVDIAR